MSDTLDQKIDQVGDLAARAKVTNVTVVLDRSGSMNKIRSDVIGGLNAFVAEQKTQEGACTLTLWTFDDVAKEMVITAKPIADTPEFTEQDFMPRGSTPLYDAIGVALGEAESRHQPGDAEVFVIITDGKENASREFSREVIFERITRLQDKEGWVFSYIGANHDAYAASGGIGIRKASTQSFMADAAGASKSFASVARATSSVRSTYRAGGQSLVAEMYTSANGSGFFQGVKEAEDEPKPEELIDDPKP